MLASFRKGGTSIGQTTLAPLRAATGAAGTGHWQALTEYITFPVWPEVATKLASLDPGVYGTFVLLGSLARGILAKMKALPLAAAPGRRRMRKPSAVLAWVETGAISTPPGS